MSLHLDEGTLQQLLDGELMSLSRGTAERHLAECAACRMQKRVLENAFDSLGRAVPLLDPPEVSLDLAHAAWRRRLGSGWVRAAHRSLPRAALFVLAIGGIASATVPGSPVRGWAESLWEEPDTAEPPQAGREVAASTPGPKEVTAGVLIAPADGELHVFVEHPSPDLRIRVRLADQAEMVVRGHAGAADASFRIGRGQVRVEEAGAGELEVVIPRAVQRASISVDGRRLLLKEGEDLHTLLAGSGLGADLVFPVRP